MTKAQQQAQMISQMKTWPRVKLLWCWLKLLSSLGQAILKRLAVSTYLCIGHVSFQL